MSGLEDLVARAELSLGLGEPNAIQDWYRARNGDAFAVNFPWCDAAVTYWAWTSGNQEAVTFGGDYALTTAHAAAFRAHGRWQVDLAGIQRGDIVFFDWGHTDLKVNIDHVGVVTSADAHGNVYTVEGIYSDVCGRHTRRADVIAGYGRPAYAGPPMGVMALGLVTFPGASFFVEGRRSPVIAAMHDRLVAVGCDEYQSPTDKDLWGSGDVASYAAWQRRLGFHGVDADGLPGKASWDKLEVPRR